MDLKVSVKFKYKVTQHHQLLVGKLILTLRMSKLKEPYKQASKSHLVKDLPLLPGKIKHK